MGKELTTTEELLDRLKEACKDRDEVTIDNILDEVGRRSFAPLLLFAGIITLAPLVGDIPGVPTIMGILVLLATGQMFLGKEHFWLPEWILERSLETNKVVKGVDWMYKPAKFIDRWLKVRMTVLVEGAGHVVIAITCSLIALCLPFMEVIPFSANVAGITFTFFGLSLIAHDGMLALLALVSALGTFGIVIFGLF